jgi:hypothetical protein
MRRLSFKIEPSPLLLFHDWRVYRDCVPKGLQFCLAGFRTRKDLTIEDCTILGGTELGNYIKERKEKFLIALREARNNDELTFTVDL